MDLDFIGWRDVVLVLAAGIGVYLALSVIRLFQVAGKRSDAARPPARQEPPARPADVPLAAQIPLPQTAPALPETEFSHELARFNAEGELRNLRRECAQLREDLVRLTGEVSRFKATGNMSPLYNEAVVLAQQGMAANGIAGHCGISIGEAELVVALARGGAEFERHEQGEVRDERNSESGHRFHG